ncbi:MAG: HepT-like ribonuclease domain-containing protein [Nanoarchaeota archaeon]
MKDIEESATFIENYTQNLSEEDFKKNIQVQDAVIRRLEIMGEASKNIPRAFKEKNQNIDWQELSSFRNFITHSYFEASLTKIWGIVVKRVPKIKSELKKVKFV